MTPNFSRALPTPVAVTLQTSVEFSQILDDSCDIGGVQSNARVDWKFGVLRGKGRRTTGDGANTSKA